MKKFITLLLFFSACTTIPEIPPVPIQDVNPPDWVLKGNGSFLDDEERGKVFYGVGSASGNGTDPSFLRLQSDNRARNDLATVVDFYTASLYKDYRSSDGTTSEQAMKVITSSNLNGVMIVDHWERPDTREIFSLAKLDLETVQENLNSYLNLSKRVQDNIRKRAEKLHRELEKNQKRYGKISWRNINEWVADNISVDYECFKNGQKEYSEICYLGQ